MANTEEHSQIREDLRIIQSDIKDLIKGQSRLKVWVIVLAVASGFGGGSLASQSLNSELKNEIVRVDSGQVDRILFPPDARIQQLQSNIVRDGPEFSIDGDGQGASRAV